ICLRTWSIARSPLKAATVDAMVAAGRGPIEILARGLGGESFFGQAAKSATKRHKKYKCLREFLYSLCLFVAKPITFYFVPGWRVRGWRLRRMFSRRT